MPEYIEVEDPQELRGLTASLSVNLRSKLTRIETRDIGGPGGTFRQEVRFEPGKAVDALYWSGYVSEDGTIAHNLFGHGTPGDTRQLYIDVQFNLPVKTFSRRSGGAFLRHVPTSQIILAHRGTTTLGHGRVKRSILFNEMVATLREAQTSDGIREFLLIGELESAALTQDISRFAADLRNVVRQLRTGVPGDHVSQGASRKVMGRSMGALRDYFDEFIGERATKEHKYVIADCYHGSIVRALRDAFKNALNILKSREIDLIVITEKHAILFEVKTSLSRQHIYTAIGQLTAHAPAVASHVKDLPLAKVIVLPEEPEKDFANLLSGTLGIQIVTFSRSSEGVIALKGLAALT